MSGVGTGGGRERDGSAIRGGGRENRGTGADTIVISDLEVWYRVGVPEAERARAQRLLLRVEMEPWEGFEAAAAGDDLRLTVDYYAVSRRLLAFGEGREWRLIETLAVELAEMVLRDYAVGRVRLEVRKFILPEAGYVAVRVERCG